MIEVASSIVVFVCPECRAGYQATQQRFPGGSAGSYKCMVCRAEVYAWDGDFHFFGWKPVDVD
jgi:DNA-directed RNA polymerase subunit RPC12/RpoP